MAAMQQETRQLRTDLLTLIHTLQSRPATHTGQFHLCFYLSYVLMG